MKDWIYGRKLMDEQPAPGGEGGGGGTGGEEGGPKGPTGTPGDKGAAATGDGGGKGGEEGGPKGPTGTPGDKGTAATGGEEEHNNALGDELNKGGEQPKGQQPDPNAPTEEEVKAYNEAIKLDEEAFGKGAKLHETYAAQLPAFFKKHGIAADKANAIVNDFVKMQKEAEKGAAERVAKFREWRQGEMKKMNDAYLKEYDQAGRGDIARAITHFFPKGSPMYQAVCMTEVGVDPGFLKAMKFIGERLAKDAAPGAAAGAGTGGSGKSLSDSFMGL